MTEALTSTIEFQMSLLLFVALAGYLVASRINQSAVVGEILVGILVGPSVLGLITYTDFVQALAQLGAIFLLFVIGFEFCLRDLTDPRYLVIAALGVAVPWIGGYLVTTLLGYPTATALFVGTALTATSIAITANVLKELGHLETPVAKAIIGAAVIDDVLSLLVLGLTTDAIQGSFSVPSLGTSLVSAVLFIGLGLAIGVKLVSPMLSRLDGTPLARQYPEFVFIAALAIAFLYAMVAEAIGLSGIVGAFIAGVSCAEVTILHSKDPREGAEYLRIIFAAIFFVSLGIIVDLTRSDADSRRPGGRDHGGRDPDQTGRLRPAGPVPGILVARGGRDRLRHGAPRRGGHDRGPDRAERRGDRPGDLRRDPPDEPAHDHRHADRLSELATPAASEGRGRACPGIRAKARGAVSS